MRKKVKIIVGLLVVLAIVITAGFLTKKWWAGADVANPNQAQNLYQTDLNQSSIIYVKIPAGVTKGDVENIAKQKNKDKSKENLLNKAVEQKFDELEPQIAQMAKSESASQEKQAHLQDYIIIYTDENNNPILPDAENDRSLLNKFKNKDNNELTFTWDFSWDAVDPNDLKQLKQLLNKSYPEIKKIYGRPAFNININIKYDPEISYTGLYYPSANEIILASSSLTDIVIHEAIHAFHDDYCMRGEPWEEGMTQLATNQVGFAINLENPSYVAWPNYELKNRPDVIMYMPFYHALEPYIDGAAAWLKLLLEDSNYFINFNKKYYGYLRDTKSYPMEAPLPWLASQAKPEVEKEPFIDWYHKQYIFHQQYFGYQLGSRVWNYSRLSLELSYTKKIWDINMPSGVVKDGIRIQIFDPNNKLVYDNIQNVDAEGKYPWLDLGSILDNSGINQGRFRIELSAKAESDNWRLRSTNYVFYIKDMKTPAGSSIYASIYGVVDNKNNGQIQIRSLSRPELKPVTISVDDGIFYTAEFSGTFGLFQLDYKSLDGKTAVTRYFTKDYRSTFIDLPYYYVFVSTDKEKPSLEINTKQVANTSATFQIKTNERSVAYVMINENRDDIIKKNMDFFKKITQKDANQECVETGLKKDTTYYYQFWAIDFAGNITKSEIKTFKTTNVPSAKMISANPSNNARNVPVNQSRIKLQFDKDLDPSTVKKENILFYPAAAFGESGGPDIPLPEYDVSYNKSTKSIIIDIKSNLEFNVNYAVTNILLKDTDGNYVENFDYSFTTQLAPNSSATKVESIRPARNSDNNPLNSTIELTFNNEVEIADPSGAFFVHLRNYYEEGAIITGTTTLEGDKKLIFRPDQPLPKNKMIYIDCFFNFKDKAGNWLTPYFYYWKFKTAKN